MSAGEVRPWREFWVLIALGFAQLCLTGMFQAIAPYAYLSSLAGQDAEVAQELLKLQEMSQSASTMDLSPEQLEERAKVLAPLFERVPWTTLGFLASLLIYPFLGRLAGRYLRRPESAGLLILLSAGMGQNPATIPMSLQYTGMGQIALPLGLVAVMVVFQFAGLAAGIFSAYEAQDPMEKKG
jgi:hypothetical protein